MTIAVMQPYFLPYIGYWQLINAVDVFVVYDNIEFSKNGWFHRNNILCNGKKNMFSIPLKKASDYLDVRERYLADNAQKEIEKIVAKIQNEYRKAPYYHNVIGLVRDVFMYEEANLFQFIFYSIKSICAYLEIETTLYISSRIAIDHNLKAVEKVIAINRALQSEIYFNPIGGQKLYDKAIFDAAGIKLRFLESLSKPYSQFENDFVPSLSILDVLMFNNKDEIRSMLNEYKLS